MLTYYKEKEYNDCHSTNYTSWDNEWIPPVKTKTSKLTQQAIRNKKQMVLHIAKCKTVSVVMSYHWLLAHIPAIADPKMLPTDVWEFQIPIIKPRLNWLSSNSNITNLTISIWNRGLVKGFHMQKSEIPSLTMLFLLFLKINVLIKGHMLQLDSISFTKSCCESVQKTWKD